MKDMNISIYKLSRINSGALKQELFLLVCVSQTIICFSLIAMDQVRILSHCFTLFNDDDDSVS